MDRFTKDELERRVDEVLFYKWDPVGVAHIPSARAEYRSYVGTILEQLREGNLKGLSDLLEKIQTKSMGLESSQELAERIAILLIEHKDAIEKGHA